MPRLRSTYHYPPLSLTLTELDLLHRILTDFVANTTSPTRRAIAERIVFKLKALRAG